MSLGPLMVGLNGPELRAEERELLRHPGIGAVILFTRNYETPAQLEALTAAIHALREPQLLIAVDHEGGRVQRFRSDFTALPPARRIGELYDTSPAEGLHAAETLGWLMAVELRAAGVDFSFAPVVDLHSGASAVIGDRAFHGDPETVSRLALAWERGMQRAGMAATAKHYPGHGGIGADSHTEIAVDRRPYAQLQQQDLYPFRRLIRQGTPAIMAAHVIYPEADRHAAGFSAFWLRQVLRGELGFQGVIFSDDLYMTGASAAGDMPQRTQAALHAGCDMALLCRPVTEPETGLVLDRLDAGNDPVAHLRLARMHGRRHPVRTQFAQDPAWRQAVDLARRCSGQQSLDLT